MKINHVRLPLSTLSWYWCYRPVMRQGKLLRPVEVEFVKGKASLKGGFIIKEAGAPTNQKALGWIRLDRRGAVKGQYLVKIHGGLFNSGAKHLGRFRPKGAVDVRAFCSLAEAKNFARNILRGD